MPQQFSITGKKNSFQCSKNLHLKQRKSMQKLKSLSLSQKDKQKIINIINSKFTPLKFKYKISDHKLEFKNLPLPSLQKQDLFQIDVERKKKRISFSNFMDTNCPFRREITKEEEWRESMLETKTIMKQEEFINARINKPIQKLISKSTHQLVKSFKDLVLTYPTDEPDILLFELSLLERKKMLKNVKFELEKKKKQLFNEFLKNRERSQEENALRKKYQPNLKPSFKQSKIRKTEYDEQLNPPAHHQFFSLTSNTTSVQNSAKHVSKRLYKQNDKKNESEQMTAQQSEIKKLRQFIDFFNYDREQKKRLKLDYIIKQRSQKTSKFIHYYSNSIAFPENQSQSFQNKNKQKQNTTPIIDSNLRNFENLKQNCKFGHRKGFINKTIHLGQQKQRNGFENGQQHFERESRHAKLRLKANHRKIVSLGKMQKASTLVQVSNQKN